MVDGIISKSQIGKSHSLRHSLICNKPYVFGCHKYLKVGDGSTPLNKGPASQAPTSWPLLQPVSYKLRSGS